MINKNILIFIIGLIYFAVEGKREAYYFHVNSVADYVKKNLHGLFFIQRLLVLSPIVIYASLDKSSLWLILSLMSSFSFIHNGFYYMKRNTLNKSIYHKRFFTDKSKTSNAFFELGFYARFTLFLLGVTFLVLSIKWL